MKKIYVYVGLLRDWVLRMVGKVREGLFESSMNNKGNVQREGQCGKADDEDPLRPSGSHSGPPSHRALCSPHSEQLGIQPTLQGPRYAPLKRGQLESTGQSIPQQETLLVRAERFLWERYEFRYNVLAKGYEFKLKIENGEFKIGEDPHYRVLDDEQKRYLLMQLQHAGINVPYISHIQAIVDCGRAQRYNPVVDYLTHLPEWDGRNHIDGLMRRVTTDDFVLQVLKRWMVAVVAQALGRMGRYGNCLCPLIISERQGWGKSQFTKLLLPPELMVHYTDTFNLTQEEQCLRKMGQHWIINLDEFDRHSATSNATLKGLLQLADIKVKRPHRAQFEEMPRLASFIGTSNRRMLLRDRTGSRRYICVELEAPIDVDTPVCHEQLYAQALHLLNTGMRYWLDEEETLRLEKHNAPYKMEHGPEELLLQHFAPVEKKKHYDEDELWSAVAVYDYLHRIDALLMKSVERTTFGMYIRRAGFEQVRRENKRFYAAKLRLMV